MEIIQQIILASASPRRKDLLLQLIPHAEIIVLPSDAPEEYIAGEPAAKRVERLSKLKCHMTRMKAAGQLPNALIIGSDTEIVLDQIPLGKPSNNDEARSMLMKLSGKSHEAITGICISRQGSTEDEITKVVRTSVFFREITKKEIERYISSGEPIGKAGGYGIQGIGAAFIKGISGSYSNVVGLPIESLYEMLIRLNFDPLKSP